MAFIYEVNGQKVEFEKEPTDKDIDEAARNIRAKPESQQQKPVEGSGGAAFGVYRPQGRRPESQQDREASKEMPIQTARGVVTGTLGAIPDIINLPGTIYSGLTGNEAPYKVPFGSEEWNQMLPFQSDTPQAKLARFGGEVLAPIPTIKGAKAIARAPGQVYRAGQEFKQGAMEGLRNPVYNPISPTRSFDPLKETYYPTPQVQAFQNAPVMDRPGMLTQLEASQQPSSSLFNSPSELLATALGPKTAQGQNLIPYQGETTRAFGETVGRDIATEPYKRAGLPSLAGATIGGFAGGPLGAILGAGAGAALNPLLRGAELFALNKLGKTAGFSRGFPEQLAEAQQLAGRTGLEASIPQTPLLSAPGPVAPTINMPGPQRNVNIEGQSYTLPNQIDVANSQTARPQSIPQTPAQQSQQLAAQKLQEVQQAPLQKTVTLQPQTKSVTNTETPSPITKAKEQVVGQDSNLQRYTKDYVVPEHLEQPINDFTSGTQKNVLAMGEPGTGKSSLAGEWMAKNPTGRFELVHTGTTPEQLRNIIKNTQLNEKNLILVDEVGKMKPTIQEMISKEVGKLPNVQVLYTSNLPDIAKVHKSITGNPSINMPLQMSAELTPAQKQAYGLSVAERWDVKNMTPEQIVERSLQGNNFRDIKRSVLENTKVQKTPLFEHQVMDIGLPEGIAKKIDNIVNNREGQRNIIIIDKAVFAKDPSLETTLNKLEGVGPIGENLTKDLVTSKTTSPIHRVQILDETDANKLSGLKGLIERSNESQYPTNIIVENRAGLKLDPALESRAVRITLDDLKQPVTKEQQLVEKFKNVPGYKAPKDVLEMRVGQEPPKTTGSTGLGQEVKLPEKKAFDPNDPKQSFEMLTEMSPTEKRYREMSKSELKVKKQLLEQDLAKAKYQGDKDLLNNALEIVNRLLK